MSSVHRAGLIVAGLLGVSTVVAACAGSDEEAPLSPSNDAGSAGDGAKPQVDAAPSDAGSDTNEPAADACTGAGWCSLDVDTRLSFDDLWPLEAGSAVAITSRGGRSAVVVYEQASWNVIHETPFVLTSVWASNTDVWVSGGGTGYVAHGHREGNAWTWTERPIAAPTPVSVVWATGEGEVYALADARVWRRASVDAHWAVDFGGDVPAEETKLVSLIGTNKDDIWVTGGRGTYPICGLVAHKTGGAWVTIAEGIPDESGAWPPSCVGVGSAAALSGTADVASATAPRELVVLIDGTGPRSVARIRHAADGGVDVATNELGNGDFYYPRERTSIWGASADDVYIAGFSKVYRGRNVWADAGASGDAGPWEISSVAFDGVALGKPFHVVRGTRSDDIWLAGESYVFHKTIH